MKTTIDNMTIEGTPTEIHDYLLLLQPTTKPHKNNGWQSIENITKKRKKRRYVMPESRKKHLSDVMKMRWQVLKHTKKKAGL